MRRAVITGLGVVSVGGADIDAVWDHVLAGRRPGNGLIEDFDASLELSRRKARRLSRFAQMSVVAARQAVRQAKLDPVPAERTGVLLASIYGGMGAVETALHTYETDGPGAVNPLLPLMSTTSAGAAAVAEDIGATGPAWAMSAACASGSVALGEALDKIRSGRCDVVIAGGADAVNIQSMAAALDNLRVLGHDGSRPFDVSRDGFGCSECAAILVVEEAEHAAARGATVLAELAGAASVTDIDGQWSPSDEAASVQRCMAMALADAGVDPKDVGQVNAHGTGTVFNDRAEATAVRNLLGADVPVTSNKGALAHAGGAAGAVEALCAVLSLVHGLIPPTAGLEVIDPELGVDVVQGAPRLWTPAPLISNSLGLGGHIASLVFTPA